MKPGQMLLKRKLFCTQRSGLVPTSNESNNDMKPCLADLRYFLFIQGNIVCVHDVKITRSVYTVLSPSSTLDHDLE